MIILYNTIMKHIVLLTMITAFYIPMQSFAQVDDIDFNSDFDSSFISEFAIDAELEAIMNANTTAPGDTQVNNVMPLAESLQTTELTVEQNTEATVGEPTVEFYSTSTTELVLYRDGKQVKTLPLSTQAVHKSANEQSSSSSVVTSTETLATNTTFTENQLPQNTNATGAITEEVIPEEVIVVNPDIANTTSESGTNMLTYAIYAVMALAVLGGVLIGITVLGSKRKG
jgi:hypothetical protein